MQYFTKIYGNENIKAHLANAIKSSTLAHALLIDGARGVGKKTLATRIAMALNCERKGSDNFPLPCETCNSCRRIKEKNFVDVKYLARQKDKATIGVEEVRLFRSDMYLSPTESLYKVYIIDEAETLTAQAQNALLIALEEPPQNVFIILLTTDTSKILTTVKSRTQYIALKRFEGEILREILISNYDTAALLYRESKEKFDELITSSGGSLGEALNLLLPKQREEIEDRHALVYALIDAVTPKVPYKDLYVAVNGLPSKRQELIRTLEDTVCAISDLIKLKNTQDSSLEFYSSREKAIASADKFTQKRLIAVYEILISALEAASKNANTTALFATLSARLKLL